MGEETTGLASSTSKLREEIKGLTGVDIMLDENTYKSTAQIIQEIGAVWDKLSDVSQAATLEKLAGKNRASTVAGLLENYETIEDVIKSAEQAEGSAAEENKKYMESIQGHIDLLKNEWQSIWTSEVTRDVVNTFVDIGTAILTGVKHLGLFKSTLLGITGIFTAKKLFGKAKDGGGRAKVCQMIHISKHTKSALTKNK
jgi:TP901 family phage tail tape measure protein